MNVKVTDLAEAARWDTMFTLLSLDKAEPFLADMGLEGVDAKVLRSVARLFRQAYARLTQQASADPEEFRMAAERLVRQAVDAIAAQAGERTARALRLFARRFPYPADADAQAFFWKTLLRRLADISGTGYELVPLRLSPARLGVILAATRRHLGDPQELQRRMDLTEREPRSAWDEAVYLSYGGESPLAWAENAIGDRRFRQAWSEIVSALTSAQRQTLLKWGRKQARLMEMPAESLELPALQEPSDET